MDLSYMYDENMLLRVYECKFSVFFSNTYRLKKKKRNFAVNFYCDA